MIALDTNILTEILLGTSSYVRRISGIPSYQQTVPVIVVEEIIRGRLNTIRRAESGKFNISIDRAYKLFQDTFNDFQYLQILHYTARAEAQFQYWRQQKIRISTHDLRIAAICNYFNATLITRNRRDFDKIPDLNVEYWE
jgi:tRNA(fMet)-specific endonuclease VapC